MDAQLLSQLEDQQYEELIVQNAHPPVRDQAIWAALTHPDNIDRTRTILVGVAARTGNALRTRKAERDAFLEECHTRGAQGRKEWLDSRAEFEDWRRRAGNFHQTMLRAVSELNRAQKTINRSTNHQIAQDQRETLRRLALAVVRHQAQHAKAGGIAEQADYELWQMLDQLTVPCGPDQEPHTLRMMLDFYWADVRSVSQAEEQRAEAERTMRSAPAGQSGTYAGVPRARHVHNRKDLAS